VLSGNRHKYIHVGCAVAIHGHRAFPKHSLPLTSTIVLSSNATTNSRDISMTEEAYIYDAVRTPGEG